MPNAQEVFLGLVTVLVFFNAFYYVVYPEQTSNLVIGAITTFLVLGMVLGVLGAIQIIGSGLNSTGTKILFGTIAIFEICFQFTIPSWVLSASPYFATIFNNGLPIGMGLINNVLIVFSIGDLLGIGMIISTIMMILIMTSGILTIVQSG